MMRVREKEFSSLLKNHLCYDHIDHWCNLTFANKYVQTQKILGSIPKFILTLHPGGKHTQEDHQYILVCVGKMYLVTDEIHLEISSTSL